MEPYFPTCHPNDLRAVAAKFIEAAEHQEQAHSRGLGASSFDWKSLLTMALTVLLQALQSPPAPK